MMCHIVVSLFFLSFCVYSVGNSLSLLDWRDNRFHQILRNVEHFFRIFFSVLPSFWRPPITHTLCHLILFYVVIAAIFFLSLFYFWIFSIAIYPNSLILSSDSGQLLILLIIFFHFIYCIFFISRNIIGVISLSSISSLIMFIISSTFLSICHIFVIVVLIFLNANSITFHF